MDLGVRLGGYGRVSPPGDVWREVAVARHGHSRKHRHPKPTPGRPNRSRPTLGDLTPTRSWTQPVQVESLRVYEGRGHTLALHVNHAPGADVTRLKREPHIAASGSFHDEATAQACVDAAIRANDDQIRHWLRSKGSGPFVADFDMGQTVGSVLRRTAYNEALARGETPTPLPATGVRIVLRRSPDFASGFFVRTAYPLLLQQSMAHTQPLDVAPLDLYEGDGYTLARNVDIAPWQLVERLENEDSIAAASRFIDVDTAQRAVEKAISERTADIRDWLATEAPRPFTTSIALDEPIGVVLSRDSLERGKQQPVASNRVHLVLVRSDKYECGFYVKTAYPLLPW